MPDFLQNKLIGERSLKEILQALERRIARQERKVAKVNTLDELTSDAGDLLAGRFIAQAEGVTTVELSSTDFTGAFMAGSPQPFTVGNFNVGGVKAGALQAGFNTDGEFVAGAGDVRLDADGVTIDATPTQGTPQNYIKFDGGDATFQIGHYVFSNLISQATLECKDDNATFDSSSVLIAAEHGGVTSRSFIEVAAVSGSTTITMSVKNLDINAEKTEVDGYISHQNILNTSEYFPVNYYKATLADDTATSFTPAQSAGVLMLYFANNIDGAVTAFYNAGASPAMTILSNSGSSVEATTGALTGTTGNDTKFTISAANDGKIYFENRRGISRTIRGRAEGYG